MLSCILYQDGNTAIAAMETMNSILLSSSPLFSLWLTSPLSDANMATQFWLEHAHLRRGEEGEGGRGEKGGGEEGGGEEGEREKGVGVEWREDGEEGEEEGEEERERGKVGEGAVEERRDNIFIEKGHFIVEASSLREVAFFCYCNVVFHSYVCCRELMMTIFTMTRSHLQKQPIQLVKYSFL